MLPRTLIAFLLIAPCRAHAGQDAHMRLGEEALQGGLWEIAALHFSQRLGQPGLDPAERSAVAVRLAEAWLRDGKAAEAIHLLDQSFAASHPEAPFWKGQALAASGRLQEALDLLLPLLNAPDARWRKETALTVRNLQLALGKPEAALATIRSLKAAHPGSDANALMLAEVEILLELGHNSEAREILAMPADLTPAEKNRARFLEGCLLLAESRAADAAEVFQILLDQSQARSSHLLHQASLGLADALLAAGDRAGALNQLVEFIRRHPDSPVLAKLFERLRAALPDTVALSDPLMQTLTEWTAPAGRSAGEWIADARGGAVSGWPAAVVQPELVAQALYAKAQALGRGTFPEASAEARRLLTRLRLEFPEHPLAGRALFDLARAAHAEGRFQTASDLLAALQESGPATELRGEAAFFEAMAAYREGDSSRAASLFEQAAAALDAEDARAARFNSALLHLIHHDEKSAAAVMDGADPALAADLALERALGLPEPAARRAGIEDFLLKHPAHPRAAEARLAAAEAALGGTSPDLSFARAQLDTLDADPEKSAALSPQRVALVRLRVADLSGDSDAAIGLARDIVEKFPDTPAAANAALVLGRHLFLAGSYNEARMVLEKLAASDTDAARAEAAWLLAARSAALIPASQSQQEALALFDKIIASKGPLAPLARLEKARLMIDMNRLAEAAADLRAWFAALDAADPLRLPAGLLLGEAVYGQGGTHADSLTEALAVYDGLLGGLSPQSPVFNRLQYLRGRTLEQIPDAADPARKREKEAFAAYYSVLEIDSPPAEWHYFELCGFRALALLEKAGRWSAAVACARKIASFKGPRAAEAEARASQLQLEHMIWED